jgi:hypothetical protein
LEKGGSKTIASTATTKTWYAGRPRIMQHGWQEGAFIFLISTWHPFIICTWIHSFSPSFFLGVEVAAYDDLCVMIRKRSVGMLLFGASDGFVWFSAWLLV